MNKYSRCEIYEILTRTRVIPVFYHDEPQTAWDVITILHRHGFHAVEFTHRGEKAREVFAYIQQQRKSLDGFIIGVGSVMDAPLASHYIHSGADFLVSPGISEEIFSLANLYKVPYFPGTGTLTEIQHAHRLGAEIVKMFPGDSVGGPDYIKAVLGPMPFTRIMPTGGVEPKKESLQKWFSAGAVCVGMGSALISKDILRNKNFQELENRLRSLKEILKEI